MSEDKSIKLFKAAKELNIGTSTIVDYLGSKGYKIEKHPNAMLDGDMYTVLLKEFAVDKIIKEEAKQISIGKIRKEEPGHIPEKQNEPRRSRDFD
jgi:translation initiation factor IF-2